MSNNSVYSYHTFLFPFIWKNDKNVSKDDFLKVLSVKPDGTNTESRWISDDWNKRIEREGFLSDYWMQDYAAYQYFTGAANDLIFNFGGTSSAVSCYYYNKIYKTKDNEGKEKYNVEYIITKKDKVYRLNINNIRLNVYDAGIAILILEMENCDYRSLDDVNAINEHGRRINFPFLIKYGGTHTLCADSIEIRFNDNNNTQTADNPFKEDFLYTSNQIKAKIENENNPDIKPITEDDLSFTYIMQPIQTLLDGQGKDNGGKQITANPSHKNEPNKFYIKPCVDDRMFVCCIVRDDVLSKEIQCIDNSEVCYLKDADLRLKKIKDVVLDSKNGHHYDYEEGWADETALSNRIYKFMYIENDLSCQEPEMKKQILSDSVYRRWVQAGTIHGITHHSLCCITNESDAVQYSVVNPFLTQYVQMAVLTLAQRAVILMLEDEVAGVSNKFSENTDISEEDIAEIERLQAKYVKVQNQILLSEVTVQEQGVEMYEMFRKQLYIEKNMNDLDSSMGNLRDVAGSTNARLERQSDKKEDKKLNLLSYALAFLFMIEPFSQLVANLTNHGDIKDIVASALWTGISFVLLIVLRKKFK